MPSAPTKNRWCTRRRRSSRRSPRTWRRQAPDPAAAGPRRRPWTRAAGAARSSGALRQSRVPARRRPGVAGWSRWRAPARRKAAAVFRETCAQCHRYGTVGKDFRAGSHPRRGAAAAPRHPALDLLPQREGRSEVRDDRAGPEGRQDGARARRQRNRPGRRREDGRGAGAGDGCRRVRSRNVRRRRRRSCRTTSPTRSPTPACAT